MLRHNTNTNTPRGLTMPQRRVTPPACHLLLSAALLVAASAHAQTALKPSSCSAQSAATVTPVLELYTSEGCSSCPPADAWVSKLKPLADQGRAVVQAFHVGYWDYIGWLDRFAAPAHTQRQRQIAQTNRLNSIYTPQLVLNGQDWRDWRSSRSTKLGADGLVAAAPAAGVMIKLERTGDQVQAMVQPQSPEQRWRAYWSVTEDAHQSKVTAGENQGEQLLHDFVVRQYSPVGQYQGARALQFAPIKAKAPHTQRVNLIVHDPQTGATLQSLSLNC
jgi:hypothetical protein